MGYISLVGTDLYADRVMAIHDSWHLSVGWNVKIRKQKKNGQKQTLHISNRYHQAKEPINHILVHTERKGFQLNRDLGTYALRPENEQ
jgi:hypothetical protein